MGYGGATVLVLKPRFDGLIGNWNKYSRNRRVRKWVGKNSIV